ncbi:MAG: outer membrane protein TolC precursor [Pseudomonadota bacterium]|jgi:outer membrane protein
MKLRPLHLSLALAWAFAGSAQAQSLLQMYETAKGHDATYAAAKAQAEATQAKAAQAKAALLPTVGAGYTRSKTEIEADSTGVTFADYTTKTTALSASMPLFRMGNIASFQQGQKSAALAAAQLSAAEQDLIVRAAQAYFDVLTSTQALASVQAQKKAVAEQLAAAKRNFEVGTKTIVDTRQAQAQYDLVVAQELNAENDLRTKKLALDQLVGTNNQQPLPLNTAKPLQAPLPADAEQWVQQALANNTNLKQLQVAYDVAKLETTKAQAGHMPTLDLTASVAQNRYDGTHLTNPNSLTANNVRSVGLSLNIPLFAGFAVQNRVKETVALEEQARSSLEAGQRSVEQGTRTAYFGLLSGLSQVKALEAALASAQSVVDATKLGYQVGVNTNVDVLSSQSQLAQTQRDLTAARHNVLLGQLKLRQAAGTLVAEDLKNLNDLLGK